LLHNFVPIFKIFSYGWRGVTLGFKGQSWTHLIYAPKTTTHVITECIEINVTI
jgi:hypothetical protein